MLDSVGNSNVSLLCLNDDCLIEICSYLTLDELVEFSFVCQRFRNVSAVLFQRRKALCTLEMKKYKREKVSRILSVIGPYLRHLIFYPNQSHLMWFFGRYCENIEEVEFRDFDKLPYKHMRHIFDIISQVKVMRIVQCSMDDGIQFLSKYFQQLEILDLAQSELPFLEVYDYPERLHSLILENTLISSKAIKCLCKNAFQLRYLNIAHCPMMTKVEIRTILTAPTSLNTLCVDDWQFSYIKWCELINLRSLTLICNMRAFHIPLAMLAKISELPLEDLRIKFCDISSEQASILYQMKTLKELKLYYCSGITDTFLRNLSISDMKLIELNIIEADVTNIGLISLIASKASITIEHLDVEYCSNINESLIFSLIDELNKQRRYCPLNLYVLNTSIRRNILLNRRVIENSKKLKILFGKRCKA